MRNKWRRTQFVVDVSWGSEVQSIWEPLLIAILVTWLVTGWVEAVTDATDAGDPDHRDAGFETNNESVSLFVYKQIIRKY